MAKYIMAFSLLVGWLFVADTTGALAQTAPSAAKQSDTLANIQASVIKAIGAEDKDR